MSEPRLPAYHPQHLRADQRDLYDRITGGPRGTGTQHFPLLEEDGSLAGPFGPMLLNPPVGDALQELGAALRYRGALPDRARELVILAVAAHHNSRFEWRAHAPAARAAGVDDDELERVRAGALPAGGDPVARAAARVALALMTHGDLEDAEFGAARETLGEAGVYEVTTLVGYYSTLALQMRVFRREPS
jgi:4-carboxymuconolactone decarboxylase